ncbi:MAG: sigma-54 factor interaction domain-containing protein [Clostridiales bacterium]|nr:sigma-54 factor interaction domain-containing protein [Clostridiales bacterium]
MKLKDDIREITNIQALLNKKEKIEAKSPFNYLIGHVKGSFTGADNNTEGIIQKADGGILFLDEIHRLPPEGQDRIGRISI